MSRNYQASDAFRQDERRASASDDALWAKRQADLQPIANRAAREIVDQLDLRGLDDTHVRWMADVIRRHMNEVPA